MPLIETGGLEVLILSGTPGEMGYEHGKLLKDRIQWGFEVFCRKSSRLFGVPYEFLVSEGRHCEPFFLPPYAEEMRALAEAAELPYEEIRALNCLIDIDLFYTKKARHCCNFVVLPSAASDGGILHGRNLDYPHAGHVPKLSTVVVRRPSRPGAIPTAGVTWVGFIGFLTGISARGISIAEVGSDCNDLSLEGRPVSFLLREALESAESADDVAAAVAQAERTGGVNIAVADGRSRQALAVETTHTQCEVRYPQQGLLVVDDVCLGKNTGKERLYHPCGVFRHARMMQMLLADRGKIDVERCLGYLADRLDLSLGTPGRNYNCICNRHTVQSVLFLPAQMRMLVAHGSVPAPSGGYTEVDLAPLLPH